MSVGTEHGVGAFLTRASDAVADLAASGLRLAVLRVEPARELRFVASAGDPRQNSSATDLAEVFPLALIPDSGRFASNDERRQAFWQPAASAPAHLHLAWLLEDLAGWNLEFDNAGLGLRGVECPEADCADVLVASRRGAVAGVYRMRIRLSDRGRALEYPSMFMQEILTDGSFVRWLASDALVGSESCEVGTFVDLREEI